MKFVALNDVRFTTQKRGTVLWVQDFRRHAEDLLDRTLTRSYRGGISGGVSLQLNATTDQAQRANTATKAHNARMMRTTTSAPTGGRCSQWKEDDGERYAPGAGTASSGSSRGSASYIT
ncbi:hypothetical protein C8039_08455 [Halogeometricum sp. wsp3]|nr:hypothetical protein C8039_08455 [Halogeometricum sp. wsp3]